MELIFIGLLSMFWGICFLLVLKLLEITRKRIDNLEKILKEHDIILFQGKD